MAKTITLVLTRMEALQVAQVLNWGIGCGNPWQESDGEIYQTIEAARITAQRIERKLSRV